MTDILNDLCNMLFKDSEASNFGLLKPFDQSVIDQAKKISPKNICIVKDWCWWSLEISDEQMRSLSKIGLVNAMIFSSHVISDESGRFREGDYVRTGFLKDYYRPAFFETTNTMYILVGKGTRKAVEPNLAKAIFFDWLI